MSGDAGVAVCIPFLFDHGFLHPVLWWQQADLSIWDIIGVWDGVGVHHALGSQKPAPDPASPKQNRVQLEEESLDDTISTIKFGLSTKKTR